MYRVDGRLVLLVVPLALSVHAACFVWALRRYQVGASAPLSYCCWRREACRSITAMNPSVHSARRAPIRYREHVRI